ncbi:MAG TPA: hypothetical protein VFB54_04980 [Burkholderiales bacterium]|nr:hypothetical protein [Burkholderiales bacterium]
MASTADMPTGQIGHPAPQRDIISLFILALAIFGVPLLWGGQLLLSYGLASFACYPSWNPLATPQYSGIRVALLAIGLAALVGGVGIAMLAVYSWRKTRGEQGGSQKHLVDIGEGRTRFLAMCGVMMSSGFVVLLIFTTMTVLIVPPCG